MTETCHKVIFYKVFKAGSGSALKKASGYRAALGKTAGYGSALGKTAGYGSALGKTAGYGSAKNECGSTFHSPAGSLG